MGTTRLYLTATIEEQWQAVVEPWLRQEAAAAWKNPQPTVVLAPSRAESFYLRSRLVENRLPYLGLRFWTPSDARKFLVSQLRSNTLAATQAELRLLVRISAEKLLHQENETDSATLKSVAQEPGPFLRAYDLLLGAGWIPSRHGAPHGCRLAREFEDELKKRNLATQAGLHRHLLQESKSQSESRIAGLLVVGFNATHWPLWDLLRAAVSSSEQALVSFSKPRFFGEEIDQLWISSWEEVTQTEAISPLSPIPPDESPAPFNALVASYEKGSPGDSIDSDLTFLVTSDLRSQIRAVVLRALDYLKNESCTRLGIVFPEANALALGVAEQLGQLGILLDDGTGCIQPGLFEKRFWLAWLAWQAEPSVQSFTHWLRACEAGHVSFGLDDNSLSARDIADSLENALGESLVDDLDFLGRHLEESSRGSREIRVVDFLRQRRELPSQACFSEFLALTRQALEALQWEGHLAELPTDPPQWLSDDALLISRRTFLAWLKESTDSRQRTRGASGNNFYGKVHLLIYAQITGQTWSHLILTGLNEGLWPRIFEAGAFGSKYELTQLNRQARSLNRASTQPGGQGIGQETVRPDHGHCLLPLEQQDLALRDLCSALDGTTHSACLTAMTAEAGRGLLPSDFFNHAYQAKTGQVLDEPAFQNLARATLAWCREHDLLFKSSTSNLPKQPPATATRLAHIARRDATQPFGPCEFSYALPPTEPIQLSCKTWEIAWNHPASVWLGEIVGVAQWPEGTMSWPRATGTWAHRWLAKALREWQRLKATPAELSLLIWSAADHDRETVQRHAREAKLELYPWWEQVWAQARSIALLLGETLAPCLVDGPFLCEYRLPRDIVIALPGTSHADFILNGRVDLLLVQSDLIPPDLAQGYLTGCSCWVIDFKTGSASSLTVKKIGEGKGLQPVLYALAIQARGATSVAISLHTADTPLKQQVELDDVLEISPLFRSLEIMHRRGIFGMRPTPESDYAHAPAYPMAIRPIPSSILEAKWALIHGSPSTTAEESG